MARKKGRDSDEERALGHARGAQQGDLTRNGRAPAGRGTGSKLQPRPDACVGFGTGTEEDRDGGHLALTLGIMLKLGFSPFLWQGTVDIFFVCRKRYCEPFYQFF